MAFTFVQAPASASNTVTPVTLAYGSNNTANNLLLAIVSAQGGTPSTPTDTAGNTWVQIGSTQPYNGNDNTKLFYVAQAKAGANTVSAAYTGTRGYLGILEFSGGAASPLDTSTPGAGAGTTAAAGPIVPAAAGELLVLLMTEGGGGLNWTQGGSYTLAWNGTGRFQMAQYLLSAPAGGQSSSMTMSAGVSWGGFLAAFTPAATPSTTNWVSGHRAVINKRGFARMR